MRILVTGGAGYIGGAVAAVLAADGHDVEVLDDLSTGHADAVAADVPHHRLPLRRVEEVLDPTFGAVVHLAARSLVGESMEHPERYWHGNIVETLALIDAMRAAGVPRLVFSSTAAVYGDAGSEPLVEDTPTRPTNPYGASKLAIDHMLTAEARAHGLAAVSLRYFNVAGAHGHLGERHDPETHLIPNLLTAAQQHRSGDDYQPARIFGTDYPTRDGTAVRDYIHVSDLAEAHVLALEHARPGTHEILNLGTGTGTTVREVVEAVREVTETDLAAEEAPRRAGDPPVLVASGARAERLLGWVPRLGVRAMIADAWAARTAVGSESRPDA
ncbi:UDP-glucose 4-epimerase GalE [Nesterenkonia marinintestina]|uniref:UDP-glucose 4-epimerase GalE n=1 Tax=Nesterenkonia marinintestina TaxID=2979865 RepID=UPI0021C07FF8|nr:UDP-glucose 4-epimerase GalE [Nesterenkonia sp. GX14115]